MHDETYRTLFAFPRMVEDLLRGFVPGEWNEEADFSTLQKLSAEYVGEDLRGRRGDTVWRLHHRGGWLYVLVLLEFQSRSDPEMALRILEYTVLLYRELARGAVSARDGRRAPVLPVVLYNGDAPWSAALDARELIAGVGPTLAPYQPAQRYFVVDERHLGDDDLPLGNLMSAVVRLERSRTRADLVRVVKALRAWPEGGRYRELMRAFAGWVRRLENRLAPSGAERLPPAATLEEVAMTLEERVAEWPKQWLREGREQGLEEGRERGLEHERALLRRMATSRFGAGTAELLAEMLARIADPERLAEVGEWLVRCDTGEEFLARVAPAAEGRRDA